MLMCSRHLWSITTLQLETSWQWPSSMAAPVLGPAGCQVVIHVPSDDLPARELGALTLPSGAASEKRVSISRSRFSGPKLTGNPLSTSRTSSFLLGLRETWEECLCKSHEVMKKLYDQLYE